MAVPRSSQGKERRDEQPREAGEGAEGGGSDEGPLCIGVDCLGCVRCRPPRQSRGSFGDGGGDEPGYVYVEVVRNKSGKYCDGAPETDHEKHNQKTKRFLLLCFANDLTAMPTAGHLKLLCSSFSAR